MRRMPSSSQKIETRRARPVIEGLETRQLLSGAAGGTLSHNGTQFSYTTDGKHVVIHVIGLGNLAGTSVDSAGELNLVYDGTNAFSKIKSTVTGGNRQVPLKSIYNGQLIALGAQNSASGVGGNVIDAVYLNNFNLVPGGSVILTPGVGTLVLNSVGAGSEVLLRELPPAPSTTPSTTTESTPVLISAANGNSSADLKFINTNSTPISSSSSTSSSADTLEAGQSTSITNEGVTADYESQNNGGQTLTGISGTFVAGTNIVEPLPTGQPSQTQPPAPPGVILKINRVNGSSTRPVNLLTDPKIFGYDSVTGQVFAFDLNLTTNTGSVDPNFTPITVSGAPASVGLNLGYVGQQVLLLVGNGTTVTAYNATTGAPVGAFTTTEAVNSIASTSTVTVLGNTATNSLEMINLSASLATGTAQPAPGDPSNFSPTTGFTLLGGLTGAAGSPSIGAAVGATFDSFQPTQPVLGFQAIDTISVSNKSGVKYIFTGGTPTPFNPGGVYTPVQTTQPISVTQPGAALGSIDQSLAFVDGVSNGMNQVDTSFGVVTLNDPNLLTALSQAFRPDLGASALVDVQGDVQSVRGSSAHGLVLNDNGNLNLVKFASVTNSTIVGQPLSHLQIIHRSNVMILTPSRTAGSRNGVQVKKGLQPIGALSQTFD
jgi:hypothetical protein